jgi:hypothetical protein
MLRHWQPEKDPTDPDKVLRVVRKSPVDGLAMQRFFGTYLRPKKWIELPQKRFKEGPVPKPRSTVPSDDLDLPHELVEAILSHLPIFDLIGATGINMIFRTIIQNSPMLQRKLFLRPIQGPTRYVQMEDPAYGRRTIVVGESDVDVGEHDDGDYSRSERSTGRTLDGEMYVSADPERKSEWQWSEELAVVDLCPSLLHGSYAPRNARHRFFFKGGEKVQFSRLTPLAEHWANMYLTNPPTTEVIVHISWYDDRGHFEFLADRTVYCESGVTIASLLGVLDMEGDVKIGKTDRWRDSGLSEELYGARKDTTISREIEELEDYHGHRVSPIMLNTRDTIIEFPGVVFREWRTKSSQHYLRLDETYGSERECQVTAEEEVLHS